MQPRDATFESEPREASLSLRQLAHELNSLLDGSLRYVSLAMRLLEELEAVDDTGSRDPVAAKLRHAQGAMVHMTELLERVMRRDQTTARVLARRETVAQELRWLTEIVDPMATADAVRLVIEIAPEAGSLPVGPLGTVLLNGLRNAVQACARATGQERRVELVARIDASQALEFVVTDTGPGPPTGTQTPAGHGLGMTLSRQIVEELGGTLSLAPGPGDTGTRLQVTVPLAALKGPER